ncbi:protein 4.2-like isoform X3 [Chroicocephalus ridibundus]|uniref:protein 4.2-like isoform X3 n=1 Tax=Chroicocephalus ridibundus TaxID=1192867 RepID=UPI002FDE9DED
MGQGLSIKNCDLKITMNNSNHHTEEISTERLIVRRGQPFTITVSFSAPLHNYLRQLKRTSLIVQTGSHPSKADGTQTEFPISSLGDKKQWSAAVEEQDPCFWIISVNTPANAPIGQYTLLLHASKSHRLLGNFTLLFNPWCQDDEVFLANEAQRQEYILNQEGIIYWGTENAVLAQPWDFSQLEEDIVDICFMLLDVGERQQRDKDHTQRKNPIYICRTVAAMLNCDEFRGILTEYGTGQYANGTPPSKWLGSSPILQQWVASHFKPVRYGQCWVFAAVMCSVLRCLGIPTRVVTGFTWAHNTNSNLSVDEYYDEDGTLLPQDKSARVWTFHVWNECWMARADLPPGYNGWQALDATCQEKSKGSLREKEVLDKAYRKIQKLETTSISSETQFSFIPTALEEPVNLFIHLRSKSSLTLGQDVPLSIDVFNHSGGEKATHLVVGAQSLHYNGVPITQLWKEEFHFTLKSNEANSLQVFVPYSQYRKELGENHLLRLTAVLKDEDSFYVYFAQEEISICDPPLAIEVRPVYRSVTAVVRKQLSQSQAAKKFCWVEWLSSCCLLSKHGDISLGKFPENMVQYQPSTVKISLLNPLFEPLEKCVVVVAGRGLIYRQRKYRLSSVQPESSQELQIPLTPIQAGPRRLTARLTCLQLQNLKSYKTIDVAAA